LAAYAFTVGCEIGVDIEQVRPVPDIRDIAARFFAPEETSEWVEAGELLASHG
jgi:phosphopantetheinyl transferase